MQRLLGLEQLEKQQGGAGRRLPLLSTPRRERVALLRQLEETRGELQVGEPHIHVLLWGPPRALPGSLRTPTWLLVPLHLSRGTPAWFPCTL